MTSSQGYATPLVVDPGPSYWLAVGWAVVLAAAAVAVTLLAAPWSAAALLLLVLGSLHEWRHYRLASGRVEWHADGSWRVATPRGREFARLQVGTFTSPWLIVLVLATAHGRRRHLLVRDAVNPVTWRRLRVRLRIEGAHATASPGQVNGPA